MDYLYQALGNENNWRRQEKDPFRQSGIKVNLRGKSGNGFGQGRHCLVDALEVKDFLVAMGNIVEDIDRLYRMLVLAKLKGDHFPE
jgi:hypothetical protein